MPSLSVPPHSFPHPSDGSRWRKLYHERQSVAATLALYPRRGLILFYLVAVTHRPWFYSISFQTSRSSNWEAMGAVCNLYPSHLESVHLNQEKILVKSWLWNQTSLIQILGSSYKSYNWEFHLVSLWFSFLFSVEVEVLVLTSKSWENLIKLV